MDNPLSDTPLGRRTAWVDEYTPSLLSPVARWDTREALELADPDKLPFHGMDVWNAYELSWLGARGIPRVAMAEIRVPCTSRNLVESKSLKLYLNSLANTRFESPRQVQETIETDVGECVGGAVDVHLMTLSEASRLPLWEPTGICLDILEPEVQLSGHDPELLATEQGAERTETLYSHLLRSRCPVTGQPDWATLLVRYSGTPIQHAGLLRYIVAMRNHEALHEQLVEQIFCDIKAQCAPRHLSVQGRFTRRGGVDINPFRSDFEDVPPNHRVVRQ